METEHELSHTITEDQAFEIAMRISEARALMYLLGTVVRKEQLGITDGLDREQQDGICGLVKRVGQDLTGACKSAIYGSPSEDALRGDSSGGHGVIAPLGEIFAKSRLQGCARDSSARGDTATEGGAA